MITSNNTSKYGSLFSKASFDLTKYTVGGDGLSSANFGGDTAALKFVKETNPADISSKKYYYKVAKEKNGTTEYEYIQTSSLITGVSEYYYIDNPINTIQEYFAHIKTLSLINSVLYTRIPVDEPIFEINANTRTINVPDDFKKNGVGVVGDKRAEYLWFKIPRYFDAVDFVEKKCRIEWKSGKKEGISPIWGTRPSVDSRNFYDYTSEPNFIIFGWCIEDLVTETAGNISFAVRFYSLDTTTDELKYSWGTQMASVAIKAGSGYDISSDAIENGVYSFDNGAEEYDRFTNSTIIEGTTPPAGKASWIKVPNSEWADEFEEGTYPENGGLPQALNLVFGTGTSKYSKVPVEAKVPTDGTGGTIAYKWTYTDKTGKVKTVIGEEKFVAVDSTEVAAGGIDGKIYYTASSDGHGGTIYSLVTSALSSSTTYYELVSYGKFDKVGTYTVYGINQLGNATNMGDSVQCIVPAPLPATISGFAEKGILKADDYKVTLDAKASIVNQFASLSYAGEMKYQWQYKTTSGSDTSWVDIEGANEETYTIVDTDKTADTPGYYRVSVTNQLNNETSSATISSGCRVTFEPSVPSVTRDIRDGEKLLKNDILVDAKIDPAANAVELQNRIDGVDKITYTWINVNFDNEGVIDAFKTSAANGKLTFIKQTDGTYNIYYPVATLEGEVETITNELGASNAKVVENETTNIFHKASAEPGKSYICLVTNIYNGEEATTSSILYQYQNNVQA